MSRENQASRERLCAILEDQRALVMQERPAGGKAAFALLKGDFDRRVKEMRKTAGSTSSAE